MRTSGVPAPQTRLTARRGERGLAMVAVLGAVLIVTIISLALVGLMNTDLTHASIQHAVARAFYLAQAGLEEAKVQVAAAADPVTYTTPASGVTSPYGTGRYTYWVDAGPAEGCGPGLKTLEAIGHVGFLGRTIWTEVRACAVGGTPFLAALFGVSRVQFQGTSSRVYLAPYLVGTPGGGGSLGSFTEINFADKDVRLNALSEEGFDMITARDGRFPDYGLYGFSERPSYNPNPAADAAPWVVSAFGDLIKAQPTSGTMLNPCGTPYACVTVGNSITDVLGVPDLREANYVRHVYVSGFREEKAPPLALDPAAFRIQAEQNPANADLNQRAGLSRKPDSHYAYGEFSRIMSYLAKNPSEYLQGAIYADGTITMFENVDLGGPSGNATLAVGGDLIILNKVTLTNRHDLTTVSGRRTPGVVVFGSPSVVVFGGPTKMCGGQSYITGSGRLVMCEGSRLVVDGLVYTQDGMAIESQASVDQVGAMYHNNRGTPNPSFTARDASVVLRFDPLALSVFGKGIAMVSWQQVH